MTYIAATLPSTATPAKDWMTALHPLITANGFSFVESWTSGGTDLHSIYKSSAASNGVGDWYLILRRPFDTNNAISLTVAEAWDATNKKVQRYIPATSSPVPSAAASYTINDPAGQLPNANSVIQYQILQTQAASAGATLYWVSVNASRIILATRFSSFDFAFYCGLGDEVMPSHVGGAGMPLGVIKHNTLESGMAGGGATREPNTTTGVQYNFSTPIASAPWGWNTANSPDAYSGRPWAARAVTVGGRASGESSPRFLLKDVLWVRGTTAAGLINGDTVTFGSKTYTRMGAGSAAPGNQANFFVDQAA